MTLGTIDYAWFSVQSCFNKTFCYLSGDVHTLYTSDTKINGKAPKLLNDLDVASDGTIYMSDSSTKWERRNNRLLVMEAAPDGR